MHCCWTTAGLKENPLLLYIRTLVKEFALLLKENALETIDLMDFPLAATAYSFNCLKEKYVYKITKDFPLVQL